MLHTLDPSIMRCNIKRAYPNTYETHIMYKPLLDSVFFPYNMSEFNTNNSTFTNRLQFLKHLTEPPMFLYIVPIVNALLSNDITSLHASSGKASSLLHQYVFFVILINDTSE